MSVRGMLMSTIGILVVLLLGTIGVTTFVLDSQKADGLQINLAGRQRMLSQRMTKEFLEMAQAADPGERETHRRRLGASVELFHGSLMALRDGGETAGTDGQPVRLPPARDREVRKRLDAGVEFWRPLHEKLSAVVNGEAAPGSEAFDQARQALLAQNVELLKKMNAATRAFQAASDRKRGVLTRVQAGALVLALILGGLAFWFIQRRIIAPVQQALAFARTVEEGDLTVAVRAEGSDEIAQLCAALDSMVHRMRRTVGQISDHALTLRDKSGELRAGTGKMSSVAGDVFGNLNNVGAAVEEMSVNMGTISQSAEEMQNMVSTVAAAVEEMSASITDVSRSMGQVASVSQRADSAVNAAADRVRELGRSAEGIGTVIQAINEIASKTNLLALNAAIEAASAGESGKGFAVVANEVKDLAAQTTMATEEIARKVMDIQRQTEQTIQAIDEIAATVTDLNESASTIAAAVEEQTATTNEIAGNMSQSAQSAGNVALAVREIAEASTEVSRSLTNALAGVKEMAHRISELSGEEGDTADGVSAKALDELSRMLGETVEQFVV